MELGRRASKRKKYTEDEQTFGSRLQSERPQMNEVCASSSAKWMRIWECHTHRKRHILGAERENSNSPCVETREGETEVLSRRLNCYIVRHFQIKRKNEREREIKVFSAHFPN